MSCGFDNVPFRPNGLANPKAGHLREHESGQNRSTGSRARKAAPRPLVRQNGPSFVVTPSSSNLQKLWGKPFESKTEPLHKSDRRGVAGLNIGLLSMESQLAKHAVEHQAESISHVSFPGGRRKGIEYKIGALKEGTDNLVNVDDPLLALRRP